MRFEAFFYVYGLNFDVNDVDGLNFDVIDVFWPSKYTSIYFHWFSIF